MSKLLFRLRDVPDDEVEEVMALLEAQGIEVYETSAGNWGISMPALWLHDESRYEEARALLDQYQTERAQRIRQDYIEARREGRAESLLSSFRRHPARFIFFLTMIGVVLYVSIGTFLGLV